LFGAPNPANDYFLSGTDNLKNEIIYSREIGLNSHYPEIGLSTDIKLFLDKISNIIYFAAVNDPTVDDIPATGFSVPKNGENATVHGLEFQADDRPYKGGRIIFSYSNTHIDSKNKYEKYSDTSPTDILSLMFIHKFSNDLSASFALYQSSFYEGLGTGNPTGTQNRADVRLAIPFHKDKLSGEIAFVVQNISGSTYQDWSRANIMGGRELITISGHID
jgi:outer membrane receptor protein involved in Fe transport